MEKLLAKKSDGTGGGVKVQEFDTTTPLDMKRAIENFGMIEQFFKMLATYLNSPDFIGHLKSLG
jgi:hypothetical protein